MAIVSLKGTASAGSSMAHGKKRNDSSPVFIAAEAKRARKRARNIKRFIKDRRV